MTELTLGSTDCKRGAALNVRDYDVMTIVSTRTARDIETPSPRDFERCKAVAGIRADRE